MKTILEQDNIFNGARHHSTKRCEQDDCENDEGNRASPERKAKGDRHPASPEDPDSSESSTSDSDARFYRRRNQDKPQKARKTEDDHDGPVSGTALKLAMQFLSRPENKRSGPRDKRYSTDDYSHMMTPSLKQHRASAFIC